MNSSAWQELDLLATRLLEGPLEPADRERLHELLRDDPAAQARFREQMVLQALLEAELAPALNRTLDESSPAVPLAPAPPVRLGNALWRGITTPTGAGLFFATLTLASLLLTFAQLRWLRTEDAPPSHAAIAPREPIVAGLVGVYQCEWNEGAAWAVGAKLRAGNELRLESGLAEIAFRRGARVVIEGPARLQVVDDAHVLLSAGKLVCELSRKKSSFGVQTPVAQVTDLGTVFAVDVDAEGETELHVWSGRVRVASLLDAKAPAETLDVGDARRIDRRGEIFATRFQGAGERFVSQLPSDAERLTSAAEASTLPVTRDLKLHLVADRFCELDREGRVLNWGGAPAEGDLATGTVVQKVVKSRPQWVADAWAKRSAVEFDGSDDFLDTRPMMLGPDLTVVAVCLPFEGQIINVPFDPNLVLGFTPEKLYAHSWRRDTQRGVGGVSAAVEMQQPMVVGYRWRSGGEARLDCNGQVLDKARAPHELNGFTACRIGRHPTGNRQFQGLLAELLIYNTALSDREMVRLHEHLAEQHQISIAPHSEAGEEEAPPQAE